jgi:hypothetical protein
MHRKKKHLNEKLECSQLTFLLLPPQVALSHLTLATADPFSLRVKKLFLKCSVSLWRQRFYEIQRLYDCGQRRLTAHLLFGGGNMNLITFLLILAILGIVVGILNKGFRFISFFIALLAIVLLIGTPRNPGNFFANLLNPFNPRSTSPATTSTFNTETGQVETTTAPPRNNGTSQPASSFNTATGTNSGTRTGTAGTVGAGTGTAGTGATTGTGVTTGSGTGTTTGSGTGTAGTGTTGTSSARTTRALW